MMQNVVSQSRYARPHNQQPTRSNTKEWWDSEAESRLEPDGLLILQGQRIAGNDLYRHCLDKKNLDETPRYQHIVFKAHDEERCRDEHDGGEPWPNGCLLDPYRLPWRMLETIKHNNPRAYAVMYQQEDGDTVGGLVDPAWITGELDNEGYPSPGCLDRDRGLESPPAHLVDAIS